MYSRRQLTGLFLLSLGAIGAVICLTGVAGVWIAGSRMQRVNSEIFRHADELVAKVDRRATQAEEAIGGTRNLAQKLKQSLQDAAAERVAERVDALPQLDNLEQRLASAIERADVQLEASASILELIEQALPLLGNFASERRIDQASLAELTETIESTRASLATVSERLADVQRKMTENRQNRDADVNWKLVNELTLGIVAKLDGMKERLSAFRGLLEGIKGQLSDLHATVQTWILTGQWLLALMMAWLGAGQCCLFREGLHMCRSQAHT